MVVIDDPEGLLEDRLEENPPRRRAPTDTTAFEKFKDAAMVKRVVKRVTAGAVKFYGAGARAKLAGLGSLPISYNVSLKSVWGRCRIRAAGSRGAIIWVPEAIELNVDLPRGAQAERTLVHEFCHAIHAICGRWDRRNFHNAEWKALMMACDAPPEKYGEAVVDDDAPLSEDEMPDEEDEANYYNNPDGRTSPMTVEELADALELWNDNLNPANAPEVACLYVNDDEWQLGMTPNQAGSYQKKHGGTVIAIEFPGAGAKFNATQDAIGIFSELGFGVNNPACGSCISPTPNPIKGYCNCKEATCFAHAPGGCKNQADLHSKCDYCEQRLINTVKAHRPGSPKPKRPAPAARPTTGSGPGADHADPRGGWWRRSGDVRIRLEPRIDPNGPLVIDYEAWPVSGGGTTFKGSIPGDRLQAPYNDDAEMMDAAAQQVLWELADQDSPRDQRDLERKADLIRSGPLKGSHKITRDAVVGRGANIVPAPNPSGPPRRMPFSFRPYAQSGGGAVGPWTSPKSSGPSIVDDYVPPPTDYYGHPIDASEPPPVERLIMGGGTEGPDPEFHGFKPIPVKTVEDAVSALRLAGAQPRAQFKTDEGYRTMSGWGDLDQRFVVGFSANEQLAIWNAMWVDPVGLPAAPVIEPDEHGAYFRRSGKLILQIRPTGYNHNSWRVAIRMMTQPRDSDHMVEGDYQWVMQPTPEPKEIDELAQRAISDALDLPEVKDAAFFRSDGFPIVDALSREAALKLAGRQRTPEATQTWRSGKIEVVLQPVKQHPGKFDATVQQGGLVRYTTMVDETPENSTRKVQAAYDEAVQYLNRNGRGQRLIDGADKTANGTILWTGPFYSN